MTTIIYNKKDTEQLQNQTKDWLGYMSFSHYLVIDLPLNRRHYDFKKATKYLKTIVKRFEKELIGRHWNKHPVHFLGIAESGDYHIWHWNLLLEASKYTDTELQNAVTSTTNYMKLDLKTMDLQPINRTKEVLNGYVVKELQANKTFHIDSDRIFTSKTLFNL